MSATPKHADRLPRHDRVDDERSVLRMRGLGTSARLRRAARVVSIIMVRRDKDCVGFNDDQEAVDPSPNPEEALIAREEPARIRPALRLDRSRVDDIDGLAIDLWYLGLTQREVGLWLGVGKARVCQRIRVGMQALRAGR